MFDVFCNKIIIESCDLGVHIHIKTNRKLPKLGRWLRDHWIYLCASLLQGPLLMQAHKTIFIQLHNLPILNSICPAEFIVLPSPDSNIVSSLRCVHDV